MEELIDAVQSNSYHPAEDLTQKQKYDFCSLLMAYDTRDIFVRYDDKTGKRMNYKAEDLRQVMLVFAGMENVNKKTMQSFRRTLKVNHPILHEDWAYLESLPRTELECLIDKAVRAFQATKRKRTAKESL